MEGGVHAAWQRWGAWSKLVRRARPAYDTWLLLMNKAPLCGDESCTAISPSLVQDPPFPSHLVAAHSLVEIYEELAGHELVGVHDVQQLLAGGVLLLQVLPGEEGGGGCEERTTWGNDNATSLPPSLPPWTVHPPSTEVPPFPWLWDTQLPPAASPHPPLHTDRYWLYHPSAHIWGFPAQPPTHLNNSPAKAHHLPPAAPPRPPLPPFACVPPPLPATTHTGSPSLGPLAHPKNSAVIGTIRLSPLAPPKALVCPRPPPQAHLKNSAVMGHHTSAHCTLAMWPARVRSSQLASYSLGPNGVQGREGMGCGGSTTLWSVRRQAALRPLGAWVGPERRDGGHT